MLNHQKGIGLIEVLVALLLLAVAVLGFSAMQMRAIKATEETLVRSDAMVIIRNISEDMRLYPTRAQKQAYIDAFAATAPTTGNKNCQTEACTESEQLNYNVSQMNNLAAQSGLAVDVEWCPERRANSSNLGRVCVIASWGETLAQMSTAANACATATGTYNPGAKCVIVETY